jgi:hypothetical protein
MFLRKLAFTNLCLADSYILCIQKGQKEEKTKKQKKRHLSKGDIAQQGAR